MFFENKLLQVFLSISICICPQSSSYNYKKQHPSMKLLAAPGLLPELDKVLSRYGSMHTMREYIYWAITEENISTNLRKKIKYMLLEKIILQQYLQNNKPLIPNYKVYLAGIMLNRAQGLNSMELATKHILKLRRDKMYGLWAGSRDIYLSITGLLMFQKVYLWPPTTILTDITIDTTYQTNLTTKHALIIGMCSLYRRTYAFAVEWFEASERIAKKSLESPAKRQSVFTPIDLIALFQDFSIQEHNRKAGELECWFNYECYMYLFTAPIRNTSGEADLTRLTQRQKMMSENSRLGTVGVAEDQLINLCSRSEQSLLPARMQVKLKCYYEKRHHPYLYIGPVKMEQLSESPLIFQYYDILGPKLMEELKAHYEQNADLLNLLNKIEYYNSKKSEEEVEPTPGYVTTITEKYQGHSIFTKFAEMVTGFKFYESAENLQYMHSTPGRGVKVHDDVDRAILIDPQKELDGDRFADLLYYVEVPNLGGHTPFCQAGVKAHLVKGSLVIWIDKFRNGTNRNDSFHGACPVIHGNKMILAQGLEYTGQKHHYECTLNQFE